MRLFLASSNPGKLREFRTAAAEYGISIELFPGIRDLASCAEDGRSFEENARKKALHYSQYTNGLVFSDDSGIAVDALGGAPGIYSARFAGPGAGDGANNEKLLAQLRGTPASRRCADYVCVIALAERGSILTVVEGRANGRILHAPRGEGGFGYDPLFFYPPLGKTFAELTAEEKSAVSHRGEAFRKLVGHLNST